MTGTLINTAAVLVGGATGMVLKKGIRQDVREAIMKVEGLAVLIIGVNGVMSSMFTISESGALSGSGSMLLLVSLVLGAFLGELLKIDDRINSLGLKMEKRFNTEGFAKGFVTAAVIFCVGAMPIMGALNEGLAGDPELMYIKSVLDGITALILASTMGLGVLAAAVPMFIYQAAVTLLASALAPLLPGELINQISMVGSAIIMAIGINFIVGQKIKTANLLPAVLIPVLYNLLTMLKSLC